MSITFLSLASLSIVAILLYFITWVLIIRCVRAHIKNTHDKTENKPKTKSKKLHTITWLAALVLHLLALHFPLLQNEPLTLNFITLGSYVMWFLSFILFITTLTRRIESLAIPIIPLTILSIVLMFSVESNTHQMINMKSGLGLHILFSLLAYSTLMLASFQAVLLAIQNKRLHTHRNSHFIRSLPSLEDMEHLLFRFIKIGVVLLSIGMLLGFYYLDNLFGSGIAHKTILSVFALLIFSILLYGRWKYGWRGKTAVKWTMTGFIVLMLAFFGTKFMQEFVFIEEKSVTQSTFTPLIQTIINNNHPPTSSEFIYKSELSGRGGGGIRT